jgi:hypothetical protein
MKGVWFNAPWGAPLAVMTGVCIVICLILPLPGAMLGLGNKTALRTLGMSDSSPVLEFIGWLAVGVPLLTLLASAAFVVRGYVVTDDSIIIKRLGWENRLDLSKLKSATVDPDALRGSWRLFGNGGFFSFSGWFRNKQLGVYRAFATDSSRTVVLRFFKGTVVVTPDDPQKFVAQINASLQTPA